MKKIIPILHNIRSLHNVGAIMRTAEGLGIKELWISGYTPYPEQSNDERLPHISKRATSQIAKTALGAEKHLDIRVLTSVDELISEAKDMKLVAIEQSDESVDLESTSFSEPIGIIFGNETEGLKPELLSKCDQIIEIPMKGKKESFNVSATAAMVLYTACNQID